jgi:carboxy-cis,cis-muconate cyclase
MRFSLSTLLLAVVPKVLGDKHYFFSGFFAGNVIAGVEFDDSTNDLTPDLSTIKPNTSA